MSGSRSASSGGSDRFDRREGGGSEGRWPWALTVGESIGSSPVQVVGCKVLVGACFAGFCDPGPNLMRPSRTPPGFRSNPMELRVDAAEICAPADSPPSGLGCGRGGQRRLAWRIGNGWMTCPDTVPPWSGTEAIDLCAQSRTALRSRISIFRGRPPTPPFAAPIRMRVVLGSGAPAFPRAVLMFVWRPSAGRRLVISDGPP